MQGSVHDILKASVMAGVDVVSGLLSDLMESAKTLSSCLSSLVPQDVYLPAPPLYCPQPASNTQVGLTQRTAACMYTSLHRPVMPRHVGFSSGYYKPRTDQAYFSRYEVLWNVGP